MIFVLIRTIIAYISCYFRCANEINFLSGLQSEECYIQGDTSLVNKKKREREKENSTGLTHTHTTVRHVIVADICVQ